MKSEATPSWKILAWDDTPQHYLNDLSARLARRGITVEIEREIEACRHRFSQDPAAWDCLILDVVDESDSENTVHNAGVRLAEKLREIRPGVPIVFLTTNLNAMFSHGDDIPPPVLVRPKSYPVPFMIMDLMSFLDHCPRFDRVFLIYGHNRESANIKEEVKRAIEDGRGIIGPNVTCETLDPEKAMHSISEELQARIRECGAVVAICTPDDKVSDTLYQPRQNVLLEVGMTLGTSDGFRRVVLLQRWGEDARYRAHLPSDLGGALTIKFYDDHEGPIEKMLQALRERGVFHRGAT